MMKLFPYPLVLAGLTAAALLSTACPNPVKLYEKVEDTVAASKHQSATAPAAPTDLSARAASASQINLSWKDNSDNEEGFEIQARIGHDFQNIGTVEAQKTGYAHIGLTAETVYIYRVRAVSATEASLWSAEAKAATDKAPIAGPNAPTGLIATSLGPNEVRLSWQDNSDDEEWFEVERKVIGKAFDSITSTLANATAYLDTQLTGATTYKYRVRAANAAGASNWTPEAEVTTKTPDTTPPDELRDFSAVPGTGSIQLSWEDPDAADLEHIEVTWTPEGTEPIRVPPQTETLVIEGLTNYVAYSFIATAYDESGNSSVESTATSTPLGKIAFASERDQVSQIYVMGANGDSQTRLTFSDQIDTYPAWSPDGTKIGFRSLRDGNYEVYLMERDGSKQTNLTGTQGRDFGPYWSPDGSRIAFCSDRLSSLDFCWYVMNPDGTDQKRHTRPNSTGISWSPDGSKYAYSTNENLTLYAIYVIDADGQNATRLTSPSQVGNETQPAWSPDGATIVFVHEFQTKQIYSMESNGKNRTQLTSTDASNVDPIWSPDGSYIAFRSFRDGNAEIYRMEPDGANQTRLTFDAADDKDHVWSPDGSKIAFASNRMGDYEIYIMDRDGTNVRRLTNASGDDVLPAWAPN